MSTQMQGIFMHDALILSSATGSPAPYFVLFCHAVNSQSPMPFAASLSLLLQYRGTIQEFTNLNDQCSASYLTILLKDSDVLASPFVKTLAPVPLGSGAFFHGMVSGHR
jgi:hypothetical protein